MLRIAKACPWIFLMLCWAASHCAVTNAAQAATDDEPRIINCHIGFGDQFKVGYWTPIWVEVSAPPTNTKLSLEVTTCDSDGVATTTTVANSGDAGRSASMSGSPTWVVKTLLYIKVGRMQSPIQISLKDGDKTLDRRELQSQSAAAGTHITSLPATSEVVLQLGYATAGLPEAFPVTSSSGGSVERHVLQVDRVDRLPAEWYGYEGVDVVVLTTTDLQFCRELAGDSRRFAALEQWVNLGGRLVVCCGRNAPQLIGDSAPLAKFVPGKYVELIRLPETRSLENFVESAASIGKPGAALAIATPRLIDVAGHVEVNGRGSELPVVVRAPRGFGELVFVGLDLDQPPLADWSGRNAFWHALLRPYLSAAEQSSQPQRLSSLGYSDLSGALHQQLGRAFASVTIIAFPIVAALIMAYLLVIGPLDYLLVHKLVGRPMVAWVSFPLIVLLSCCGAAGLSRWSKGTQVHVNQAELVDFDAAASTVRGSYWSTLYSPRAERHDLTLAPRLTGGAIAESAESLLSWFGLAGSGLGGMQVGGTTLDIVRTGYRVAPELNALDGVPILSASAKAFTARWTAPASAPCSADLKLDEDGLAVGTIKNTSSTRLGDACLLCGQWGYRLGDLAPGQQIEVGSALNPVHGKTLLSRRARRSSSVDADGVTRGVFKPDQATLDELVETMMFYNALGGEGFAGLPNRYQADCDLSRLLDLGRAILVTTGDGPGSQLVDRDSGAPLAGSDDPSTVVYRVVFPVSPAQRNSNPEP